MKGVSGCGYAEDSVHQIAAAAGVADQDSSGILRVRTICSAPDDAGGSLRGKMPGANIPEDEGRRQRTVRLPPPARNASPRPGRRVLRHVLFAGSVELYRGRYRDAHPLHELGRPATTKSDDRHR